MYEFDFISSAILESALKTFFFMTLHESKFICFRKKKLGRILQTTHLVEWECFST